MASTSSPQWVLDLNTPPSKPKTSSIPDPPGYTPPTTISAKVPPNSPYETPHSLLQSKLTQLPQSTKGKPNTTLTTTPRKQPTPSEMDTLKLKKAWELALGPAKSLPMSAIGMYMSGNSLQIFSIMMVFMLFKTPITAIIGMGPVFARFETPGTRRQLWGVKAVFVACNCLALALGIWKVNGMGLLPTTRSDWLAWETERVPVERAFPAFPI